MQKSLKMKNFLTKRTPDVSIEGVIVYATVGYETVALTTNFLVGKKVIPPITDYLGPLTHSKYGWIIPGFIVAWAFKHFWAKGEEVYILKLNGERVELTVAE